MPRPRLALLSALAAATVFGCEPAPPEPEVVTLTWTAPLTDSEGACSDDLAGFLVEFHPRGEPDAARRLDLPIETVVCEATAAETECGPIRQCSYELEGLTSGEWVFEVRAYDSDGQTSEASNEALAELD